MAYNGQLHDHPIIDIITEKNHPGTAYSIISDANKSLIQTAAHKLCMATMLISKYERRQCGKFNEELESDFTKGNDDFPTDLVKSYHLINRYNNDQPRAVVPESSGVALVQENNKKGTGAVSDKDKWQLKTTCHNRNKKIISDLTALILWKTKTTMPHLMQIQRNQKRISTS